MKSSLTLLLTFLILTIGTATVMSQTNDLKSENPEINEAIREFAVQSFWHNLPPKIESVVLCRQLMSLDVEVRGFSQSSPNSPEALGELNLQVWLLWNNGTAVPLIDKPDLVRDPEPMTVSLPGGNGGYEDSMVYHFAKVPLQDLAGVVIRASGKLYCYEIDQSKWQK